MVKLPVIVYNHEDKTEVINSALQLQRRLEQQAIEEEKNGGKYIRPIVLFQAQPKSADDHTTFEKLKEKLIALNIPEAQIKIKTANINELKNEDLLSRDCQVRYIITVNALKEGWDCPFAYILASLADKSSPVDVEQILGRVLRQPYVMKHTSPLLNLSYVLTASSKFIATLDNIVKGLNKAGFSNKDYKLADAAAIEQQAKPDIATQLQAFMQPQEGTATTAEVPDDIDISRINVFTDDTAIPSAVSKIEEAAIEQNEAFEMVVAEMDAGKYIPLPSEISALVKTQPIKDVFKEEAAKIALPQFFLKTPAIDLFGKRESEEMLDKENLLRDFALSKADTNISFDSVNSDLYKVDLDETRMEHTPTFVKIDGVLKEGLLAYILDPSRKDTRVKNFTKRIMSIIGNIYPIPDSEIEKYVKRILEDFTDEQFTDFSNNEYTYTDKIKAKIKSLSDRFAEKQFQAYLDTDKVVISDSYAFPTFITPGDTAKDMPKTLYEKEGRMNGFEERVINEIANFSNILFWTRNNDRTGFRINGFINHYPDFIIQTKTNKTIVLETKGDHLEAEQKIKLGNLWASKAGNKFRYFLVYDKREVNGAYQLDDCLELIRNL